MGFCLTLLLTAGFFAPKQILLAQSGPAPAPQDPPPRSAPSSSQTHNERWNFGLQVGFALQVPIPRDISHIALLIAQPQLGIRLWDFNRTPLHRLELVNEGIFGNAVHPGGRLTGYTLLFRLDGRNFGRAVPFLDLGAGVQHTTLEARVPELTGRLQFSPQGGVGIQYFFHSDRALVLEYRYMHMSNAGLAHPNPGFNASMLSLGFRWLRAPALPRWHRAAKLRRP